VAQHKTASKSGGKGRASKRSTRKTAASRLTRSGSAASGEGDSPLFPINVERPVTGTGRKKGTVPAAAGDEEISIDRRRSEERRLAEQASGDQPLAAAPQLERRKKVNRRRQIDPTTCERDYTEDEVEFMNALDEYKRRSGRMFPTCSEVLEVVRDLGYMKLPPAEFEALRGATASAASAKPMPTDWPASIAAEESDVEESGRCRSCEALS
jgi:hypothetical protein